MAEGPRVWAATRVSLVRTANEDGWRVDVIAGDAPDGDWSGSLPSIRPRALVADGMGDHGSGDVASSIALDALCRHFDPDGVSDIRSAIAEANWAVFSAMDEPPGCMSQSFARFVLQAERADTLAEWRDKQPRSGWMSARLLLLLAIPVAIIGITLATPDRARN